MRIDPSLRGYFAERHDQLLVQADPGSWAVVPVQELLARIAIRMRRGFAENFAVSGRPSWPPLAESTYKQKLALYLAGAIRGRRMNSTRVSIRSPQPLAPGALFPLIRYGHLRDAATRRNKAGNITRIDPTGGTLEVGVSLPYASVHQHGSARVPPRPFLTLTDSDWDDIAEMTVEALFSADRMAHLAGLGMGGNEAE